MDCSCCPTDDGEGFPSELVFAPVGVTEVAFAAEAGDDPSALVTMMVNPTAAGCVGGAVPSGGVTVSWNMPPPAGVVCCLAEGEAAVL